MVGQTEISGSQKNGFAGVILPGRIGRLGACLNTDGRRYPVTIMEASGYDIRCTLTSPIHPGDIVEVAFPSVIPTVEVRISGVAHWVHRDADRWRIGLALKYPVPREFLVQNVECRRQSIRFECCIRGEIHWGTDPSPTLSSGNDAIVVNYARDGICLMMSSMAQIGATFRFVWRKSGKKANLTAAEQIDGNVRWVGMGDQGFLVGCEIISGFGYSMSGINATGILAEIDDDAFLTS